MTLLSRHILLALLFALPCLTTPLHAQSIAAPHYWVTAGAGWGMRTAPGFLALDNGSSLVAAGTIQSGAFVASGRWARAHTGESSTWDAGLLVGLGSPTRYRMRGSIAAGLGRVSGFQTTGWTLPVEVQLAWRLREGVAVGLYGFGSFAGPQDFVGTSVVLQLGHF